jgi:tetraacyldisaccharide 4'-kinase
MTPPADSPPLPGLAGRVAARLYDLAVAWRNRGFDRGKRVVTFDRPVISVGNISVGGTGKTPTVALILDELIAHGHLPCVAMRGYGARSPDRVSDSDEAGEYLRRFPGLAIVAQPNRTLGLIELFGTESGERVDVIVLDDGFQHRQIARQLDLVLVDASRSPFADRTIPAGWLREPVANLARATGVIITHAELATDADLRELQARIQETIGRPPLAVARHTWSGAAVWCEGRDTEHETFPTLTSRTIALCAIGNPHGFLRQAESALGRNLVERIVLPDHDPYAPATVARVIDTMRTHGATTLLTTEKDWSKLQSRTDIAGPESPWTIIRPRLRVTFDRGESSLRDSVLSAATLKPE